MAARKKDPTDPIRKRASSYSDVDQGTSCSQSSFKAGKKPFLYIGMQGGRYKAMFKLGASKAEAAKLAKKAPDDFQVGSTAWVTARFSAEEPMPKKLWGKWLDESYALSVGAAPARKTAKKTSAAKKKVNRTAAKKTKKTATKKKVARKKTSAKKTPAQKPPAKKTPAKRAPRKKASRKKASRR